jgi:hypothetical protein
MQADFVAYIRAEIEGKGSWWPETLVYLAGFNGPFEIFARSISRVYFDKVKSLLAIDTPEGLEPLLNSYKNGSRQLPRFSLHGGFNPAALLGKDNIATRP